MADVIVVYTDVSVDSEILREMGFGLEAAPSLGGHGSAEDIDEVENIEFMGDESDCAVLS